MGDTSTEAVKALLEGVTPGPWVAVKQPNFGNGYIYTSVQPIDPDPSRSSHLGMANGEFHVCRMTHTVFPEKAEKFARDARFIAASRELVPALLAERDAALADRDEWKSLATSHHPNPADHRYWEGRYRDEASEVTALRDEVARLREALSGIRLKDTAWDAEFQMFVNGPFAAIANAALTAEPLGLHVTAEDFGGEG